MPFLEIFEFHTRPGNEESVTYVCQKFCEAAMKIEGVEKMNFLVSKKDPNVLWQSIQWKDEEAVQKGTKFMFNLSEMGLFSAFIMSPPQRIGNFEVI